MRLRPIDFPRAGRISEGPVPSRLVALAAQSLIEGVIYASSYGHALSWAHLVDPSAAGRRDSRPPIVTSGKLENAFQNRFVCANTHLTRFGGVQ